MQSTINNIVNAGGMALAVWLLCFVIFVLIIAELTVKSFINLISKIKNALRRKSN